MKKQYIPIALIMLLSLSIHLFFLVDNPGFYSEYGSRDAEKYDEMAHQLVEEGFYGYNADHPNAYVTPSHPLYLSGIILIADALNVDNMFLTKIFNMLLNMIALLSLYFTAKLLFKNEWIASLTALLYGTYLAPLHFFRSLLTEAPGTAFFLISLFALVWALKQNNWKWHVVFGIIACITIMFRPTPAPMLLFAWFIVIYQVGFKRAVAIGFLWCVGPLLVLLPWVIRNYLAFGEFYLFSSHSGNPMLAGTNPFYLEEFEGIFARYLELGISQEEYAQKRIIWGLQENFALWFSWFTIGKTIVMFEFAEPIYNYRSYFNSLIQLFIQLQHLVIVIGGFVFGFIFRKNKAIMCLFVLLLGYVAFSNIFLPLTRYGSYVIGVMCIITAYGIVTSGKWLIAFYQKMIQKKASHS
ncbi:glycosyltransferase family 39 protein [Jeotgalibacillus aurantiacus]|uniref:glycosyltransferase family 39 protein n=1 Tax=Jeotgalibacillus aurantiacus TaxID=2763266 RepID=UPI001D0B68C5|nr:glycosyltransferase family 39 protein [Jeotgalibacillus aurantiacus]